MPRRKYAAYQESLLDLVHEIHDEHIAAKLIVRREIEKAYKDKMIDFEIKKSRAMNVALAAGIAKTDLGRAIGTSNFSTITELLARTANDLTAEELYIDPLADRYSFDGETLTVTLTGEDWTKACWELDWNEALALKYGLNTAQFTLGKDFTDQTMLQPITADFMPEYGNRHPVVVFMGAGTPEALEWVDAKRSGK